MLEKYDPNGKDIRCKLGEDGRGWSMLTSWDEVPVEKEKVLEREGIIDGARTLNMAW